MEKINARNKRYEHICSVVKRIDIIAMQYGLDREKCRISAMLHDISTLIKWEDMLPYATDNEWTLCDAEISHPFLLHQRISEVVAREDFGITDLEVLEAIAFHTSLCENASQYQMALFIADKLDWSVGGHPPYYEQMSVIHSDWAKAVNWIKKILC